MPEGRWMTAFPFMVSDTLRFTANDKDVSLSLEMTVQEFLPSPSLLVSQSPVTNHQFTSH